MNARGKFWLFHLRARSKTSKCIAWIAGTLYLQKCPLSINTTLTIFSTCNKCIIAHTAASNIEALTEVLYLI